jgi:predicted transcriptional regulator
MDEFASRRDFLLSIRPQFANLIVSGKKTVEFRRRFTPRVEKGAFAMIYCTSPIKAIVGFAYIQKVDCLPLKKLWSTYGHGGMIDKSYFLEYFAGLDRGYALVLKGAKRFETQIEAGGLKSRFGFVAPQSFAYLPAPYYSLLENDQLQASY